MSGFDYRCGICGKEFARDMLVTKKVYFQELGVNPKIVKVRTEDWLCPGCVVKDKAWRKERHEAPGTESGRRK
jgi:hypothetical protein